MSYGYIGNIYTVTQVNMYQGEIFYLLIILDTDKYKQNKLYI